MLNSQTKPLQPKVLSSSSQTTPKIAHCGVATESGQAHLQVIKYHPVIFIIVIPHPNPPLRKVRGLDFPVSPQYIGGTMIYVRSKDALVSHLPRGLMNLSKKISIPVLHRV